MRLTMDEHPQYLVFKSDYGTPIWYIGYDVNGFARDKNNIGIITCYPEEGYSATVQVSCSVKDREPTTKILYRTFETESLESAARLSVLAHQELIKEAEVIGSAIDNSTSIASV
ncbi:MAG: hypothetical protein VW683_02710 [Betaproteobacteria bacterium]